MSDFDKKPADAPIWEIPPELYDTLVSKFDLVVDESEEKTRVAFMENLNRAYWYSYDFLHEEYGKRPEREFSMGFLTYMKKLQQDKSQQTGASTQLGSQSSLASSDSAIPATTDSTPSTNSTSTESNITIVVPKEGGSESSNSQAQPQESLTSSKGEFSKTPRKDDGKKEITVTTYLDESAKWKRYGPVGAVALLRRHPETQVQEVLIVTTKNHNYKQPSTTFPGGHCEIQDETVWHTAIRELQEEVNVVLNDEDRKNVLHVYQAKRVFTVVLTIDYNDERLNNIKIQDNELLSHSWVPLHIDMSYVASPQTVETPSSFHDGVDERFANFLLSSTDSLSVAIPSLQISTDEKSSQGLQPPAGDIAALLSPSSSSSSLNLSSSREIQRSPSREALAHSKVLYFMPHLCQETFKALQALDLSGKLKQEFTEVDALLLKNPWETYIQNGAAYRSNRRNYNQQSSPNNAQYNSSPNNTRYTKNYQSPAHRNQHNNSNNNNTHSHHNNNNSNNDNTNGNRQYTGASPKGTYTPNRGQNSSSHPKGFGQYKNQKNNTTLSPNTQQQQQIYGQTSPRSAGATSSGTEISGLPQQHTQQQHNRSSLSQSTPTTKHTKKASTPASAKKQKTNNVPMELTNAFQALSLDE